MVYLPISNSWITLYQCFLMSITKGKDPGSHSTHYRQSHNKNYRCSTSNGLCYSRVVQKIKSCLATSTPGSYDNKLLPSPTQLYKTNSLSVNRCRQVDSAIWKSQWRITVLLVEVMDGTKFIQNLTGCTCYLCSKICLHEKIHRRAFQAVPMV